MQIYNLTPAEIIKSLLRRPLWFLAPVVLCTAASWGILRVVPPVYRASTLVMVEKQKVPSDYVKATVTSDMDERLKTMEQQITNRDNLERIIRELKLYPHEIRDSSLEDVVDKMRERDLAVQRQGDVFRIYYRNRNPVVAADVANRIAELFIDENLRLRENQAQGTSSFLETELGQTKLKLEQQEARIAAFKQRFMGQLPEQRDTNLQGVTQLQAKLEMNMDALDKAETRKIFLQRQISELLLQPAVSPLSSASQMTAGGHGSPAGPAAPTRLDQLRAELLELRGRYTDRHPDVIRTRSEIARLEALERANEASAAATAANAANATNAASEAPAPVPSRPRVDPALRAQLDAVDMEIKGIQAERQRTLDDISRYQARLENVPRVEQDLLSLTRDYDNIKKSYDELLSKRIEARLAENLEKSRQGEQFTILEKAVPPSDPYAPNPLLFLGGGLVLGSLAGLGAALFREQTDATCADAGSLQEAFPGVPVLATVPIFSSKEIAGLRTPVSRFGRA
jgi:polysaccharide chain length determinant protein (PEP-CTERM system associated)